MQARFQVTHRHHNTNTNANANNAANNNNNNNNTDAIPTMGWWLFSWVWEVLGQLGLAQKSCKILFLGLDNAGKTTLLHRLKDDRLTLPSPTQYPTSEELVVGSVRFQAFDLGGHTIARRVWGEHMAKVGALVFLVDAVDRERFAESKRELDGLLTAGQLDAVPVLVLANKIDAPKAAGEDEVRGALGLHNTTTGKDSRPVPAGVRPLEVFCCSVVKRQGYKEGFQWLSQYIV